MARHNKKRNTGLLYEFLTRHMAERLVENDEKGARDGIKLLKKHFRRKTELYREFRLFHALVNTTVNDRQTAQRIVSEARSAAKAYDKVRLEREKALLIRGINHTLKDDNFYDKRVDEYKVYATVQTLLNQWRDSDGDLGRMAQYEEDLVEWLVTPKRKNVLEEQKTEGVDALLLNILFKKIDNKYKNVLNSEQVKLVNDYVYSLKTGDDTSLREMIGKLRESTLKALDSYISSESLTESTVRQLNDVRSVLAESVEKIDDSVLSRYLRIAQLKQEILGG